MHLLFTGDPHGSTTEAEWKVALATADEDLGLTGLEMTHAGRVFLPAGKRDELLS